MPNSEAECAISADTSLGDLIMVLGEVVSANRYLRLPGADAIGVQAHQLVKSSRCIYH
jgi:hypothetical protein